MQIHAYCQQKNGFRTDAEGIEVGSMLWEHVIFVGWVEERNPAPP